MTVEAVANKLMASGELTPVDFVSPGPGQGVIASAAFSSPFANPYAIQMTFKTATGCTYAYTFPITGPAGFTVQLSTSDISDLVAACWIAMEL